MTNDKGEAIMMNEKNTPISVALTGQPNVGKSTVFNMLTGMSQHVGNWSGKTVEKKEGTFDYKENSYSVVDLPGTYSLTANSPEEAISRDFIIKERPDVVVAILNAAALERNLYLVSELLPLEAPVVVALNMMDVAKSEGHQISPEALEKAMGVRVVPMVASKSKGLPELMQAINEVAHNGDNLSCALPIRHEYLTVLKDITGRIDGHLPGHYPKDWIALKLLEGDGMVKEMMKESLGPVRWGPVDGILSEHKDAMLGVAGDRYAWIEDVCKKAVKRPEERQMSVTARWDRFATHPVWGIFIMLGILAVGMLFTKRIGLKVTWDFMDVHLPALKAAASSWLTNAPPWVASMVVDGLISGVGILLIFVVFLTMFYAVLGFLEDVGYLSRVGFMMHRFMSKIGLHGKSCLPLCVGFACNIPGVIGTRVVETERARLMTILLTPFIPCIAQLTVAVLLAPIFFGSDAAPFVVAGLVLFNIVVLGLSGKLLNRVLPNRESLRFIMELPLYHWPNPRTIAIFVWQHMKHFVEKAGTVIVAATVLIWALSYFPHGDMDTSILSSIGQFLEPLGKLLGLNWQLMVALFASFLSKESTLVSLGVLVEDPNFVTGLQAMLTPAAGLGFLVVNMLFIPCITTFAVIVTETKSWKWSLLCVGYLFTVAFGMGILIYQVARHII